MSTTLADPSPSRDNMVDGQLCPNGISDPRILAAMRRLPRERFLPDAASARAYADADVPLSGGRCLIKPMLLARLVQAAAPQPGERVLVVGAGAGYGAAVIAACGAEVVALEEDPELLRRARALLPLLVSMGGTVQPVEGPLAEGWPGRAPYDLILVEGGFEALPPALVAQLRPEDARLGDATLGDARLVGVRISERGIGTAVRGLRGAGTDLASVDLALVPLFDCATAVLPALRRKPGFRF